MMTAQAKGNKALVILLFTWANRDVRLRISRRTQPPLATTAALIMLGYAPAPEQQQDSKRP